MSPASTIGHRHHPRFPPLPEFRRPVLLDENAVREMCRLAGQGYDTRLKRETYGFLFGTVGLDRCLTIRRAEYYRGGTKTRTGVTFKDWATILRIKGRRMELARTLHLRYVGSFHSHVEIAGGVFRGLSDEDRESFRSDPMSFLEAVVSVWAGTNQHPERSPRAIVCFDPRSGYHYRIKVYAKLKNGIRQVAAKAISSDIVVVF